MSESPATFLTLEQAADVRERFGTPCYVYDRRTLESVARAALDFPAPFGCKKLMGTPDRAASLHLYMAPGSLLS